MPVASGTDLLSECNGLAPAARSTHRRTTGGHELDLGTLVALEPEVLTRDTLRSYSTIAITLDTYSHVVPGMGDAAERAIDDALA